MKRHTFVVCLAMAAFSLVSAVTSVQAQDKIVAVVNGDIITQRDLDNFVQVMRIQLSNQYAGPQLEERIRVLRQDLLQRLIEDRLILQEAKKEKLEVESARIEAKLDEARKGFGSQAAFGRALQARGLSEIDLRQKFTEQLLMFKIIEAKIRRKITISPREITDYYTRNPAEFRLGQEREFDSIVLDNQAVAAKVYDQLKAGSSLDELAKEYSFKANRFTAHKGGELKKDIEDLVFSLKQNEVSSPLALDGNYYIFKLNQISPERQRTIAEAQSSIHAFLFEKKMQESLAQWLDQLKKASYIKVYP